MPGLGNGHRVRFGWRSSTPKKNGTFVHDGWEQETTLVIRVSLFPDKMFESHSRTKTGSLDLTVGATRERTGTHAFLDPPRAPPWLPPLKLLLFFQLLCQLPGDAFRQLHTPSAASQPSNGVRHRVSWGARPTHDACSVSDVSRRALTCVVDSMYRLRCESQLTKNKPIDALSLERILLGADDAIFAQQSSSLSQFE